MYELSDSIFIDKIPYYRRKILFGPFFEAGLIFFIKSTRFIFMRRVSLLIIAMNNVDKREYSL